MKLENKKVIQIITQHKGCLWIFFNNIGCHVKSRSACKIMHMAWLQQHKLLPKNDETDNN